MCNWLYSKSWRFSRPRLNDKQGAQQLIDFGFRVIIMSDLQLRQRQILNLFERVAQPLTPKPDIFFELPEFVVNFFFISQNLIFYSVTVYTPLNLFIQFPPDSVSAFRPPADGLNIPELELVKTVPRGRLFSTFHPGHREAAYALVRIFKSIL
jgi:hypothetical protein